MNTSPLMSETIAAVRAEVGAAATAAGRDPAEVTLLAATKTVPAAIIREAVSVGLTVVGENRVQEFCEKVAQNAYENATVHFIGRLQRNKAKFLVGVVDLIHSIDSLPLLDTVNRLAERAGVRQAVLLEVNIAAEPSKGGFLPEALFDAVETARATPHLLLRGLMCIPPREDAARHFSAMQTLYTHAYPAFTDPVLSMGMSDDFPLAIAHGATLVRIGSKIFGGRPAASKA